MKEAQAADRVYRIGQKEDVLVCYPIAKDPQGALEMFDEKLDALIQRRRRLASEFLAPLPSERELEQELINSIREAPTCSGSAGPITENDARSLPWERFEALAALLEEKHGAKVILIPRAGDDKANVLAVRGKEIRLVQCKHTVWGAKIDADVLAEVIGAIDLYRARYLRKLSGSSTILPVVMTNGRFTPKAKEEAQSRDVQLIGDADLWQLLKDTPCTPAEIETMEDRRLATMRDLLASIATFGSETIRLMAEIDAVIPRWTIS